MHQSLPVRNNTRLRCRNGSRTYAFCQVTRTVCRVNCSLNPHLNMEAVDRRTVLLGTLATFGGAFVPSSQAGVLDGTVEWWKNRKRANSAKLIAPIKVAQQRLEAASAILGSGSGSMLEVLQLVRSSSLNCYLFEALPTDSLETRASLLTQSANISDPCTFRIIVKNVVDFASAADQERGAALLNSLILSYQKLDSELESAALEGGGGPNPVAAGKAAAQLATTLQLAYDMEGFVREVLLLA